MIQPHQELRPFWWQTKWTWQRSGWEKHQRCNLEKCRIIVSPSRCMHHGISSLSLNDSFFFGGSGGTIKNFEVFLSGKFVNQHLLRDAKSFQCFRGSTPRHGWRPFVPSRSTLALRWQGWNQSWNWILTVCRTIVKNHSRLVKIPIPFASGLGNHGP